MVAINEYPPVGFPTPTVTILTGSPTNSPTGTARTGPSWTTETVDPTSNRFLTIMSNGSDAERVLRGFLFGVVVGLAIAVVSCCWLPCFRRARRAEREQMGMEEASVQRRWVSRREEERREDRTGSEAESGPDNRTEGRTENRTEGGGGNG